MPEGKYAKYVSRVVDSSKVSFAGHKPSGSILGPLYSLLGEGVMPAADMRIVVRHVLKDRTSKEFPDNIDRHTHDVSKAYVILSEGPEYLSADITLGDETYSVTAPGAVFVPPGVEHNIKLTGGHGFVMVIMPMTGTYNEHTFPVDNAGHTKQGESK